MGHAGVIILSAFAIMLVFGMPIAFCLGLAALGWRLLLELPTVVLAQRSISGTQLFTLLAIPGFVLTGDLMMQGGLSRRLIRVGEALVAHDTGGLGMVTVLSATFFAAISGSAPAMTAAVGKIMIPEMEKKGWGRGYPAALATASGPIGQMILPSIPFVIWGVVSEQSIGQLFLAGIVPGLMIAALFMVACYVAGAARGDRKQRQPRQPAELGRAIWDGKCFSGCYFGRYLWRDIYAQRSRTLRRSLWPDRWDVNPSGDQAIAAQ